MIAITPAPPLQAVAPQILPECCLDADVSIRWEVRRQRRRRRRFSREPAERCPSPVTENFWAKEALEWQGKFARVWTDYPSEINHLGVSFGAGAAIFPMALSGPKTIIPRACERGSSITPDKVAGAAFTRSVTSMRAVAEKLQDRLAYPPRLFDEARAAAYIGFGTTKFGELVDEGIMSQPIDVDGTPRWDRLQLDD
jgi:hypothetical protein